MIIPQLLPLLIFCFTSAITPGPNNIMILNSGLRFGIKRSLPHYLGVCLGFTVMVLLIALGMGEIFVLYPWIKHALAVAGSLYLFYLAIKTILAKPTDFKSATHTHTPWTFLQAVAFQWVNPKAWLMTTSAISVFTLSSNPYLNALWLSFLYLLTCLPSLAVWLGGGAYLQKVLKTSAHQRIFNLVMALGLIASIALIWIE